MRIVEFSRNIIKTMDLSHLPPNDRDLLILLCFLEGDLNLRLYRVEEGLGNLDEHSEEFTRLNEQFQMLVILAQKVNGGRIRLMQSYGL